MNDATMSSTLRSEDEEAVRELVERASRAQSDADALVALHTRDAVVVNFFGRRILGRDAFDEAMRAALSTSLSEVTTDIEIIDVRAVTDDVVLVSCVKTVNDRRDSTEEALPASSGALTYVVTRADEGWRIALAQTTPMRT